MKREEKKKINLVLMYIKLRILVRKNLPPWLYSSSSLSYDEQPEVVDAVAMLFDVDDLCCNEEYKVND